MSVSLWVGNKPFEIGSVSFLKSLFSTVYIKLEGQNWGKLFPTIMNEFYTGELDYKRCDKAVEEIMKIREMLREFQPDQIVWDFENLEVKPPWGENINPSITSLANYFWTSDGKDLFDVLISAFSEAKTNKRKIFLK
jgi:2,3-bisphosphoglycerate-dependent phosphoglycerate mutase